MLQYKVYTCSSLSLIGRVVPQSSQDLQLHQSSQVYYTESYRDMYPHFYENITLKNYKLKITISNSFFPLWPCVTCMCKSMCTDSTMTTHNSGASRLFFKQMDQMEVDTITSSNMERSDSMKPDTPSTNLKRLIAQKEALKENKKTKNQVILQILVFAKVPHTRYWLDFSTMEQLTMDSGIEEIFSNKSVANKDTREISQQEAQEMEKPQVAYLRILQQLYPKVRSDNILDQHYNIIQILFGIPTNPDIGLSLDYHVVFYFEPPRIPILYNSMVFKRCNEMEIPLGQDLH